jgi:hypothetical protein
MRNEEEQIKALIGITRPNIRFADLFPEPNSTRSVCSIAENPSLPPSVLEELASYPDKEVKAAVGDNRNTAADTLMMLARDDDVDVRYTLAENHNIPLDVLQLLLEDDNPYVADRARRTINRLNQPAILKTMFGFGNTPSKVVQFIRA